MSSFKNLPIHLITDPEEDEKEHFVSYKTVTFLFFYVGTY